MLGGIYLFAESSMGAAYALRESSLVGKVVLIILFGLSIVAWSVMFTKFRQLGRARRTSDEFLTRLRREKSFLALFSEQFAIRGCPLAEIYASGCRELKACRDSGDRSTEKTVATKTKLSALDIVHIESSLERSVSEQAMILENQVMLLGLAVSAAPFLGLLGTVWGVMDAFAGIAAHGNTTIGALAPGVSAALITTVTGLSVAIPSMVGYNILVYRIRAMTVAMDNFASEFMTKVRRETGRDDE